jgi:uncharacterized protein DUF6876
MSGPWRGRSFQLWKLAVDLDRHTATLTCDDGNGNIVFSKQIEFTDFPLEFSDCQGCYGSAKILLGVVEAGSDPIAELHKERAVRTFGAVTDDFLASHIAVKRKGRTGDEYRRILQGFRPGSIEHAVPALHIASPRPVPQRQVPASRLPRFAAPLTQ